jgi:2-keto-4-pentenoate hydratase
MCLTDGGPATRIKLGDEMSDVEREARIAARLRDAYTKGPIEPFASEVDGDVDAAYRIQDCNTGHALKVDGRRIAGYKIGLTSVAVQKQLGVDQPDFGVLFEDMAIGNGAVAGASELLQPRIEAEIAFGIGTDLDDPALGLPDLLAAIEWVAPALEVVDSRILDWRIGIVETIADNASSGRFVIGPKTPFSSGIDLVKCEMSLQENGQTVSRGNGAACLGNPLLAALWLARKLVEVGRPVRAGELVLSGALGPMVKVREGCAYRAAVEGIGEVSVVFGNRSVL